MWWFVFGGISAIGLFISAFFVVKVIVGCGDKKSEKLIWTFLTFFFTFTSVVSFVKGIESVSKNQAGQDEDENTIQVESPYLDLLETTELMLDQLEELQVDIEEQQRQTDELLQNLYELKAMVEEQEEVQP